MTSTVVPLELERVFPKLPAIEFTAPLDASTLKGKSILVTGGASGIGLAYVEAAASYGAFVTIADLQQEAGETIAKDLSLKGYKVQFMQCDVTSYQSQFTAFKSAIEFGEGRIDVVVPSAGIIAQRNLLSMAEHTEPSLDAPPPEPGFSGVEVNLKGVYYTCYLALHYFRLPVPLDATPFKKGIVLIASVAGYLGYPHSTTYSMSKFGVRGILYGIRDKAREAGVRVNLIAPWYIKTAMTTKDDEPAIADHLKVFGFAPMENVVDALLRFSADEGLAGRSAVIMPEGNYDIGDDIWDGFGGMVMQQRMSVALTRVLKIMAELQKQKEQQTSG